MNSPTHPSLRCQAHWQNTQSQRYNQILPKSLPARPTPTHGGQDSAAKMEDKLTEKINNETPTKCICHKGFSGYSSIVARSNFRVGGQVTAPQSLTAHTLDRYKQAEKKDNDTMKMKFLLHKDKRSGNPPHIQAHLAAPTHGRPLRSQKSLHFANAPLKDSDLFE